MFENIKSLKLRQIQSNLNLLRIMMMSFANKESFFLHFPNDRVDSISTQTKINILNALKATPLWYRTFFYTTYWSTQLNMSKSDYNILLKILYLILWDLDWGFVWKVLQLIYFWMSKKRARSRAESRVPNPLFTTAPNE